MKFCANLSFMYQESVSLLERYSLAKQSGFTAVECAFPYTFDVNDVKSAKEKAGLQQILINTYPGDQSKGELGFAAIPGQETEFKESALLAVKYAKSLGCSNVHIMSGIVKNPDSRNDDTFEQNLRIACEIFKKENITGLIEPINSYSVPFYYLHDYEKAIDIIKKINEPNLKLQLDLFHLQHLKGDLTNNIKRYLPYVGHIQVAQVPNRHEPDTPGEINYNYVFNLLKAENYSGWIGLEYKPAKDTKSGLKWLDTI